MTSAEIRVRRTALGMTQGQLARLVGVDARTWRHWENGDRSMPEPVARLLNLLDMPGVAMRLRMLAG